MCCYNKSCSSRGLNSVWTVDLLLSYFSDFEPHQGILCLDCRKDRHMKSSKSSNNGLEQKIHCLQDAKKYSHQLAIPAWVLSGEIQDRPYDHTAMWTWQHDHRRWRLCQGRAAPSSWVLGLAQGRSGLAGSLRGWQDKTIFATVHLRTDQASLEPYWVGLASIRMGLEPGTSTWPDTQFTRLPGEKWLWRQILCI